MSVVDGRSVTSQVPQSSESTSSVVVREVSDSTMRGGSSLFCSSTFHVAGEDQLHIYVHSVPRGEKKLNKPVRKFITILSELNLFLLIFFSFISIINSEICKRKCVKC